MALSFRPDAASLLVLVGRWGKKQGNFSLFLPKGQGPGVKKTPSRMITLNKEGGG